MVGNFELIAPLASGGQAVVAEARHRGLGHRVALKLLDPEGPAADVERFRQEGQVLSRLEHPSLPRVLDLGEQDGLHYLALELIEGPTLEERLDEGLPPPLWSAARVAEVADALEHCHQAGLVHRDVKPPNVLLRPPEERAVLCDFGLVHRDPNASRFGSVDALALSRSGEVKGSPEFMAPEQVDTDLAPLGPAADVHGLGATLYYLLTGEPPFSSETSEGALDAALSFVPTSPRRIRPEVPAWLDALCLAALAKEVDDRPPSAAAFARALRSGGDAGSAEDLVDLSLSETTRAAPAPKRRRKESGRARRPRSGRQRPSPESPIGGAIGLESADELPAYRPASLGAPAPRPRERSSTLYAWLLGAGFVAAFLAAGALTLSQGPLPGAALFTGLILPLGAALARWGNQRRPPRVLPGRPKRRRAAPPEQAGALLERARALLGERRDPGAALVLLDELLAAQPEDAAAFALRARARVARGELAAAGLDLDRALELDPSQAAACAERGALRFRLGDLAGATQDFDHFVALRPTEAGGYASRGACHYKAGELPAALRDFDRCLELSPGDPEILRRRGRVRFKSRDFEGAAADWSAVLAKSPRDTDALRKRAVALRRLGREDEARADEERLEVLSSSVE